MLRTRRLLSTLALALCAASALVAQSVTWSPDSGTLQRGKRYSINLDFTGCSPDGQPPADLSTDQIQVELGGGIQSITSGFFGRAQTSIQYSYQISAKELGQVVIPSFEVQTDQGAIAVPEARFEVVEASVGNTGARPEEVLLSRFVVQDDTIYQGEVFTLDYYAGAKQFRVADLGAIEWTPQNLLTSGLEAVEQGTYTFDRDSYTAVRYSTQAMATEPGSLRQGSLTQPIALVAGQRNRGGFFPETYTEEYRLESEPLSLEILPLPQGAPSSFSGAVGEFALESRIVPENVQVGEPVTWTLTLSGTGNWPSGIGVPSRSVSSDFRAIQPEVKSDFPEGSLFSGSQTEDIVLIPTAVGEYRLGPLEYSYFDPKEERYRTLTVPATTVSVASAAPAPSPTAPQSQAEDEEGGLADEVFSLDPTGENAALRPPSLPKEPVQGLTPMPTPSGSVSLARPALLAVAAPAVLWLILALVKTLVLDPSRRRRAAYRALRARLTQPVPKDPEQLRQQQYAWRRDARAYWEVASSEPSPQEVAAAARQRTTEEKAEQWAQLWRESDRILYSGQQRDAQRWMTLYRDAMQGAPKPGRDYSPLFTRPAWLGLLAAAVGLLGLLADARADDARIFYDAGDFANAEREWVKVINQNPSAWEPRYNAGLAAAQRKDWGRAWAYWASAFCLNPREERIAWNLRLAQAQTSAFDPTLQSLLEDNGLYRMVSWRSPAEWERLALWLMTAAGAIFCLAVIARYWDRVRRLALPLLAVGVVSALAACFAQWAHSKYDHLASPETVLFTQEATLRSIPADLGPPQLQASVSEGSTGLVVTKRYLGWSKVQLPNEDEGWVRSENYISLYGPISQAARP